MTKIVIDKEVEIAKLEDMLENLTDDKDKQSVRFAINLLRLLRGFNEEERPQGKWYHSIERGWHCSECDEVVKDMPTCMRKATYKFCPNCGADMRGDT